MKQLVLLSGKGGTGKTTVASSFVKLAAAKAYADCDVDAPNLHLLLSADKAATHRDFYGMDKAVIDSDICTQCDDCRLHCRFNAIEKTDSGYHVVPHACEGCGVCTLVCPVKAAQLHPVKAGDLTLYQNDESVFSSAILKMGNGNSGLLVTEVKNQLQKNTTETFAVIDGSPGIGCPVIATLAGADVVLIVAEPSLSGLSDMQRIVTTAQNDSDVTLAVCINKHDVNPAISDKIENYCHRHGLIFTGRIPYDDNVLKLTNNGLTAVDKPTESGRAIKQIFAKTMALLT